MIGVMEFMSDSDFDDDYYEDDEDVLDLTRVQTLAANHNYNQTNVT